MLTEEEKEQHIPKRPSLSLTREDRMQKLLCDSVLLCQWIAEDMKTGRTLRASTESMAFQLKHQILEELKK